MKEADPRAVERYIAAQPPPMRAALARARAVIRKAIPRATERISYRIPTFEVDGRMVIYLAGFKEHYAVYPATAGVIAALGKQLDGHLHNKATIRSSYVEQVPAALITRIVKVRAAEAAALVRAKAKKTASNRVAKRPAKAKAKATTRAPKKRATKRTTQRV